MENRDSLDPWKEVFKVSRNKVCPGYVHYLHTVQESQAEEL